MGEVYRGRDIRLDRTVAIKILPSHLSSSPRLKSDSSAKPSPFRLCSAVETIPGREGFEVGRSQTLFSARATTPLFAPYDVTPDGQRFLIALPLASESSPLVLISDWKAELKR
jgi:hypothetical protein